MTVRPYQASDEEAVRRICLDTAFYGRPIEECPIDPALAAEALLGYYVRFEPDALFVADVGGEIGGYVAGARDTRRFARLFAGRVAPRLALHFVRRGHWMRAPYWRLAVASVVNGARWSRIRGPIVKLYPAHCHVNVAVRFRGQGLGDALVRRLLELLKAEGIAGVHVSTESDEGAAFFAKQGFRELARYPMMPMCGEEPRTVRVAGRVE